MANMFCADCGRPLSQSASSCQSCGSKNRIIVAGDKGVGKDFVVEIQAGIGLKDSVDVAISEELHGEEASLWKTIKPYLSKIRVDGFEIGLPSGIKILFKVRR